MQSVLFIHKTQSKHKSWSHAGFFILPFPALCHLSMPKKCCCL